MDNVNTVFAYAIHTQAGVLILVLMDNVNTNKKYNAYPNGIVS